MGFWASVMDRLEGFQRPVPKYPDDLASTNPRASWRAMREFLLLYGPYQTIKPGEPLADMDTLVFRHPRGGPGHVAFFFQGHVYHAGLLRVTRTTLAFLTKRARLIRVFRSKKKHSWLSRSLSSH